MLTRLFLSVFGVSLLVTGIKCGDSLYDSSSEVVSLTTSNFDRQVTESDSIWVVEFYAPWCGHCKQLVPEYQKAAKALKGVVKVGGVNVDVEKSLGSQYGVQGFPTIKIFTGKESEEYSGGRTAKDIVDAALRAVRTKVEAQLGGKTSGGGGGGSGGGGNGKDAVIELTDSNFDKLVLNSDEPWLVEFYAPWCGHCKQLAPEWAKAAKELKGKVNLGALDATVHQNKASEYGIKGYPTIKFFPAGKKKSAEEYDGGRTADAIIEWATPKGVDNTPPPELIQVTSNEVVEEACGNHPICIVSVLPHILDCDAKCRNGYLTMLRGLGDKYKKQGWGWIWTQGADYLSLEEALDIGGFGYPAMAAVNLKKGKYSIFRGSFSEEGIASFLRDLSYGRGSVAPLRGTELPKVSKGEAWDGKDGVPPVDDDFIDLDMDEKDEL